MMSGYYPEFYLRKRQREQAYRRATVVIVGFLLLIVVGGIAGFFIYKNVIATRRTQPGASPELAEQRQKLETQQKIADARLPASASGTDSEQQEPAVDLKAVPYSESFPQVQVGLEGIAPASGEPANTVQPTADTGDAAQTADSSETADGAPNTGEAPAPPSAGIGAPGNPAPSQPTPQDSAVARVKTDDQAAADKKTAEEKHAADKRKLDDQRKRDQLKKDQAKLDAKAAAKKEEKPEARPEAKPAAETRPAGEPKYVYTVYASTYLSQDDAEKAKGSLGAIGLSGSVINAHTGDYLLMVGSLNDIDSANALKAKLAGSGFGGAFVTRKVKK